MSDDCEVIPLFSTPLFIGNISIDTQLVLNFVSNLKYGKYPGSGEGSENEDVLELEELSSLKTEIDKAFEIYLYEFLMYEKNQNFSFTHETSWVNLHHKDDYSPIHNHQNSMYSFVFFVDVDENSGDIVFSSGRNSTFSYSAFDIPVSSYNVFNSHEFRLTPKNNMIIIFPSHVPHYVTINKSEKERYTIAGNYFFRGSLTGRSQRLKL